MEEIYLPKVILAKLVRKEKLKENIIKFGIEAREIINDIKPGQFIEIKVEDNTELFLRRPISIYNVDEENGILEFIFRIQGEGTEILAKKEVGDIIDIIGPLGYGTFKYEEYKNIAILGGGIGVFPLYELAKRARKNSKVYTYLGFRDEESILLEEEFKKVSDELTITVDNVGAGLAPAQRIKGFAIDILRQELESKNIDCIFACGPLIMLKFVQKLAKEKNIPCQISLEEKMGCGFGVCLGCAVSVGASFHTRPQYEHVCKQGPVFNASKVEL